MHFLLRLLLVPLAGLFILVARWAVHSSQQPAQAPLAQASRCCVVPAAAQGLAPAFATAGIRSPQQVLGPGPAKRRLLPAPQ